MLFCAFDLLIRRRLTNLRILDHSQVLFGMNHIPTITFTEFSFWRGSKNVLQSPFFSVRMIDSKLLELYRSLSVSQRPKPGWLEPSIVTLDWRRLRCFFITSRRLLMDLIRLLKQREFKISLILKRHCFLFLFFVVVFFVSYCSFKNNLKRALVQKLIQN